jgi:hypothetical protein
VAEGLGALMRRPVELAYFNGFLVAKSEVVISHLQCMDDALFIGKAFVENLWSIKVILRWFKLITFLNVNFTKSMLFGLLVGANPRKASS